MQRLTRPLVLLGVAVPLVSFVPHPRIHINTTNSMPRGVYVETSEPLAKGVLVVECLPVEQAEFGKARGYLGRGNCPGNTVSLLKKIVGIPGSTVELADEYVAIDSELIFISATLPQDKEGREIPHVARGTFTLGPDEFFLMAAHPRSWDDRYKRQTDRANIRATVRPLLTEWGSSW